jgi:type I restriction enzyme S subunit
MHENLNSWPMVPLHDIADIGTGVTLGRELGTAYSKEYPYLRVANVQDGHIDTGDIKTIRILPFELTRYQIQKGDILLTEGGDFDKLGRGAVWDGIVPDCLHQNHIFRVRLRLGLVPEFFAAYMSSTAGRAYFLSCAKQTTNLASINKSQLSAMPVPVPPSGEQQRIAEVIDSVDEKIQATMRLIAKQRELRVASIRQLAADGLACLDGVEASELNRGTRHSNGSWALVPLGSVLAGIDAGHSPDLEDTPAGPGQWGVLKVSAVGEDGFRSVENKIVRNRGLYDPAICVRPGDLLMTRANTSQLVGRSCIVENTPPGLMLCDKTLRLRVDERSVPTRYVHIILGLAEVRRQIEIAATGTSGSMKNISQQSIRQLMIPMGGPQDVKRVAEIDTLGEARASALRREIEGLRLLKQGLIDDLLTGRMRVPAG